MPIEYTLYLDTDRTLTRVHEILASVIGGEPRRRYSVEHDLLLADVYAPEASVRRFVDEHFSLDPRVAIRFQIDGCPLERTRRLMLPCLREILDAGPGDVVLLFHEQTVVLHRVAGDMRVGDGFELLWNPPPILPSTEEIVACSGRPIAFNALVGMLFVRTLPPEVEHVAAHSHVHLSAHRIGDAALATVQTPRYRFVVADGAVLLGSDPERWLSRLLQCDALWPAQTEVLLASPLRIPARDELASTVLRELRRQGKRVASVKFWDADAIAGVAASMDWTLRDRFRVWKLPQSLAEWRWTKPIRWPAGGSAIEDRVRAALDSQPPERCEGLDVFADWAEATGDVEAPEIQSAVRQGSRVTQSRQERHAPNSNSWHLVCSSIGPVIVRAAAVLYRSASRSQFDALSEVLSTRSARLLSPSRLAILNSGVPWAEWIGFDFSDMQFGVVHLADNLLMGACFDRTSFYDRDRGTSGFLRCELRDATFRDADLRNTRFSSVDADNVCFDGADLRGARFGASTAREASFRNSTIDAEFLAQLERAYNHGFDLDSIREQAILSE